ncbi:MAG: transglutaminase domain-containing protein, partial [Firmicutes bacterium]|nr:transglutaminase domain-containing protein [Bacillota bacterium]
MIGTAFLLLVGSMALISLGGMVCSLLSLPVYGGVLGVWAVIGFGLCLFFYERPKYRLWLVVGGVVFLAAVVLLGGDLFRDGLGVTLNAVKDLFGVVFSRIYLPFDVSGNHNEALAVTVFLLPITLMFAVLIAYSLLSKGRAVLLILLLSLIFLLVLANDSPFLLWYIIFSFSLLLLFIVRSGGIVKNRAYTVLPLAGGIAAVILSAGCLLPLLLGNEYEKPAVMVRAETFAEETLESVLWRQDDTHNLPEGQFEGLSSLERTDTPALEVTMSELSSLYLRGYVGTVYGEKGWQETDKETLYEYADLFYWLHESGFYGTSQLSSAASAAGMATDEITVSVNNLNANDRYIYSPYEYVEDVSGDAAFRIGDTAPSPRDREDIHVYSYTMTSNLVRNSVELAQSIDENVLRGNEDAITYLECENAYREYVYATCLNIPEEVETVLASHFGEADTEEGHEDYDKVMQDILNELLTVVTYNEDCGESGGELVRYFLETNAEGYSVHYATAAAMIFRYYGIPARYV